MSKKEEYRRRNEDFLIEKRLEEDVRELRGGVLYRVLESGAPDGPQPSPRSIVTCRYRGQTIGGKTFDENFSAPCAAAFRVNELIPGFQVALVNMRPGDRWQVYIPSDMAYGPRGAGRDIPGGGTLVFEILLVSIA